MSVWCVWISWNSKRSPLIPFPTIPPSKHPLKLKCAFVVGCQMQAIHFKCKLCIWMHVTPIQLSFRIFLYSKLTMSWIWQRFECAPPAEHEVAVLRNKKCSRREICKYEKLCWKIAFAQPENREFFSTNEIMAMLPNVLNSQMWQIFHKTIGLWCAMFCYLLGNRCDVEKNRNVSVFVRYITLGMIVICVT